MAQFIKLYKFNVQFKIFSLSYAMYALVNLKRGKIKKDGK